MGIPMATTVRVAPESRPLERKAGGRTPNSEREDVGEELTQGREARVPKKVETGRDKSPEGTREKFEGRNGDAQRCTEERGRSRKTRTRESVGASWFRSSPS